MKTTIQNLILTFSWHFILLASISLGMATWFAPVISYAQAGALDLSFDTDGKVTTTIDTIEDIGYATAIQADGKIVVAGYSFNIGGGGQYDFEIGRAHV